MGVKSVPLKPSFRQVPPVHFKLRCAARVLYQCEPSEDCYPTEALSWSHCTSSTRQATCAHWWPLNYQDSHSSLTCADCKMFESQLGFSDFGVSGKIHRINLQILLLCVLQCLREKCL